MTPARRGMLLMVLFGVAWAAVEAIGARFAGAFSPYQVVFTRYVVHLAALAAICGWRAPAALWRTRRPAFQLARSLLMVAMPASWILAAEHGAAPRDLLSVFWVAPLLVLASARLVLGERAGRPTWIAAGLASAGAIAAQRAGHLGGAALAGGLGMAASFALYVAMTRALRGEETRANLFYTALGVVLVLAARMPAVWRTPAPRELAARAAIGGIGLLALWALDRMAALAPVSLTAPFAAAQVLFATGTDLGLRRGLPSLRTAAALALILLATLHAWHHDADAVREPA
jgi:drug/metabolite transporter (DMT)-like permease